VAIQTQDLIANSSVVLKIYYEKNAMSCALNEFKMLYAASNAPSTVRVNCLMHNPSGKYVALDLEDLTSYMTLFDFC
jgi:hypothetical protein